MLNILTKVLNQSLAFKCENFKIEDFVEKNVKNYVCGRKLLRKIVKKIYLYFAGISIPHFNTLLNNKKHLERNIIPYRRNIHKCKR